MKFRIEDFEGVAFDFDGTLANAHHVHEESRLVAFGEHGLGHITLEQQQKGHTYGTRPNTIIAGVLREAGVVDADIDPDAHPLVVSLVNRKREIFLERAEQGLDAQDGSIEAAKLMGALYLPKMAIVTTAMLGEIKPFIGRYDLGSTFTDNHLITDDTMREHGLQLKPAPDAYLLAANIMGISDVLKMIVIEDSTGGVESGKRAGATTIAVGTTNARDVFFDQNLEYHPDYFFANFAELSEAFKP